MNKDQLASLIRTILKLVGAALVTHGATKTADLLNSEDVIGLVITLAGLIWSHFEHAPTGDDKAVKNPSTPPVAVLFLVGILTATMFSGAGCKTGPDVVAYKAEVATISTVDAAMQAWGDYVRNGGAVTQGQIDTVKAAYDKYYAAQQVAKDALSYYVMTVNLQPDTRGAQLQAANAAVAQASADLITLVQTFLKKGAK